MEVPNMEDAPMQYSPKLKNAMAEISEVLKKHDIAGMVILHEPGHAEFNLRIDPSYSCAKMNGNEMRVRAKLQEDFNGDKEAWTEKITDTVNMFESFFEVGMMMLDTVGRMDDLLKTKVDVLPGKPSSFTTTQTQNN
jgi:hypothetical protein